MKERNEISNAIATSLVGAVVASAIAVPFVGFLPLIVTTGGIIGGAVVVRVLIAAAAKKPEPKDDDKEDDVFDW